MRCLAFILFLLASLRGMTQVDSTFVSARKNSFYPIPFAFWTPETRLGIGAALIHNFYVDKSDSLSPPSQLQGGFAITQEHQQLYSIPFQIFWNQRKNYAYGEVGYFRYHYKFYGVGNDPRNTEEHYGFDFTRLRLNFLRKVLNTPKGGWHLGLRTWIEDWQFTSFEEAAALSSGEIVGSEGGLTIDPGVIIFGDHRDDVYFPRSGTYIELVTQHATGDYQFHRYRADLRNYKTFFDQITWANQLFIDLTSGDTPFYMMTMLGGTKRMRGYYEGRYRDKSGILFQSEVRSYVWKRWGAVIFASAGLVDQRLQQWTFQHLRYTGGGGIRYLLDPEKHINVRFDVAGGKGSLLYYFTVGEAF